MLPEPPLKWQTHLSDCGALGGLRALRRGTAVRGTAIRLKCKNVAHPRNDSAEASPR